MQVDELEADEKPDERNSEQESLIVIITTQF